MSYTAQKRIKSRLKQLAILVIGFYVMIGSALYFIQDKMLFRPSVLEQDYVYEFNYPFEELFLNTAENAVINAIHFTVEKPLGLIVYFHGNAGELQRWGIITEYFVAMGYDVLVMDYRSYGKSTGPLSEEALYHDGDQIYAYALQRYAESDITLYGRSLGSGIASKLAAEYDPKRLILESPFYSIADVAQHRFPIFPVRKMLNYELPNFKHLAETSCPITIFHGTEDYVVPFSSGEKLAKTASKSKIDFVPVQGGGHNDLISFETYKKGIEKVLKE